MEKSQYGYIDRAGKVVVPTQFKTPWKFSEGRAGVRTKDRFGFIDQTGEMVIQPRFDKVAAFSEGLARVAIGGKWGFVGCQRVPG